MAEAQSSLLGTDIIGVGGGIVGGVLSGLASGVAGSLPGGDTGQIHSREVFLKFLSTVTADAFMKYSQSCVQTAELEQDITVGCAKDRGPGNWYEENEACQECLRRAQQNSVFQRAQERRMWHKHGKDVKVRRPIDERLGDTAELTLGCLYACKPCIVKGVSQYTLGSIRTDCQMTSEELFNWKNEVTARMGAAMYSRQDTLSALTKALGNSQNDKTVVDIQRRIDTQLTNDIVQVMTQAITSEQDVTVRGTSVAVSGISQVARVDAASKSLVDADFGSNILKKSEWDTFSRSYKDGTTLDSLGNAVVQAVTSFENVIKTTLGGVMFGVILVLGAVLLVILLLLIKFFVDKRSK